MRGVFFYTHLGRKRNEEKCNNDKTILRVAIYVRVSTEQQAEDGDSIGELAQFM